MALTKEEIQRVKLEGFLLNRGTECFNCRVITENGTLTGEEMRALADIASRYHSKCVFTTRMTVEIVGVPFADIAAVKAELAAAGLSTGGTGARVRPVTACKGTTCVFGFYDTQALGKKIHDRFYVGMGDVRLPHKFKIAVGGCPNNCIKPDLNDVGIVGQHPPVFDPALCRGCKVCQIEKNCRMGCCTLQDGKMQRDTTVCNNCGYCIGKCPFKAVTASDVRYRFYIGGRWGRLTRHATLLPGLYTEEEVLGLVEKSILLFRDRGKKGERFAAMIDRIGEQEAVDALLHGDLMERREAILAKAL